MNRDDVSVSPPRSMIDVAIELARQSPCAKSRRGAVLFDDDNLIWGAGWNGPPVRVGGGLAACDGSDACREHCAKRCMHAEMRAILSARTFTGGHSLPALLHVKIDEHGDLVAGGGPSCWQCSRLIVDVSFVTGVWLHQRTLAVGPEWHQPSWHWYAVADFHRITAATCNIT